MTQINDSFKDCFDNSYRRINIVDNGINKKNGMKTILFHPILKNVLYKSRKAIS